MPSNSGRGPGRAVRRRTRTFRPNYLSFAGTYQCNLSCPHCCVPIEWTDRLDVAVGRTRAALRQNSAIGKVFREGLTAIRDEIVARDPNALPAATSNHCFFCWYVLTRGLAAGVAGGGGQIGHWTGSRPNFAGESVQIGLLS